MSNNQDASQPSPAHLQGPSANGFSNMVYSSGSPPSGIRHTAHRRFVALVDVLGMKEWLKKEPAQNIADFFDEAMAWSEMSSKGEADGQPFGPLITSVKFSDSLFFWAPDDSWVSFITLSEALRMIMSRALKKGVPLRGSISVGEVVCNQQSQSYIGNPIADAYHWTEDPKSGRPYKSVGIDFTPETIQEIQKKLEKDPIPTWWGEEHYHLPSDLEVLQDQSRQLASNSLIWYEGCLFINHWSEHFLFLSNPQDLSHKQKLENMFHQRELNINCRTQKKLDEMLKFFEDWERRKNDSKSVHNNFIKSCDSDALEENKKRKIRALEQSWPNINAKTRDRIALDQIRIARQG